MHRKAEEEADTAVVSATHPGSPRKRGASGVPRGPVPTGGTRSVFVGWWTTQRGAAWARQTLDELAVPTTWHFPARAADRLDRPSV
jgi:hypothetical protein